MRLFAVIAVFAGFLLVAEAAPPSPPTKRLYQELEVATSDCWFVSYELDAVAAAKNDDDRARHMKHAKKYLHAAITRLRATLETDWRRGKI